MSQNPQGLCYDEVIDKNAVVEDASQKRSQSNLVSLSRSRSSFVLVRRMRFGSIGVSSCRKRQQSSIDVNRMMTHMSYGSKTAGSV